MSNPSQHISYRPHNPGHNYYDRGIYLITVVVAGRQPLLASLNMDAVNPVAVCSELGQEVMRCWNYIPEHHSRKNRKIVVHAGCCMPDHFHGVIEVCERMDVSVGEVICGFKIGCTQAYRRISANAQGAKPCTVLPCTVLPCAALATAKPCTVLPCAALAASNASSSNVPYMASQKDLHHMSHKQRQAYYATLPRTSRPLFDDNYDDTICITTVDPVTYALRYDQRHFSAMVRYVFDNPRRAILRRLRPDFMQRRLHIRIAGRDYAAFGNIFLLRWARKVQVFCHRKAPDGSPYHLTALFEQERARWIADILAGATVIVTPGISKGEQVMKNECLDKGYPLIHIQKEPITQYWKPELKRFETCTRGSLLILAPWNLDDMGEVNHVPSDTDFSRFHNLNELAREICLFDGDAAIVNEL